MSDTLQTIPTAPATPAAAPATPAAEPRATSNRSSTPASDTFKEYISSGWAESEAPLPSPRDQAPFAAARRARLSVAHPGRTLVIPAGSPKTRSNDCDYTFRAHSAFTWLTGWGSDTVAGSVLVLAPRSTPAAADTDTDTDTDTDGHDATLYFRGPAGRNTEEFYANAEIGEFWTGPRPSAQHVAADLGLATAALADVDAVLASLPADALLVRDADDELTRRIDATSRPADAATDDSATDHVSASEDFARELSEARLVKDEYEIRQMRLAVEATAKGFSDVIADRADITAHPRGERLVEGTFNRRARADGNTVGYDTIAASGDHACILHWTRNDGPVAGGDLILIDAGIEVDSLYTADITRTLPVDGTFTEVQRRVYEAVLEAADAAFAIVRPGIRFRELHQTAMGVIARKTAEWGLLPVTADQSLEPDNQYHRRYMVHGTSHHLGLDVHDCARARRDLYLDGVLEAGMIFTIEPGLYFRSDDLTVPEEYRGIGVRIEDDILVTESGAENLSVGIPRTVDDVEAWLA